MGWRRFAFWGAGRFAPSLEHNVDQDLDQIGGSTAFRKESGPPSRDGGPRKLARGVALMLLFPRLLDQFDLDLCFELVGEPKEERFHIFVIFECKIDNAIQFDLLQTPRAVFVVVESVHRDLGDSFCATTVGDFIRWLSSHQILPKRGFKAATPRRYTSSPKSLI
jgi:hypothetical protein